MLPSEEHVEHIFELHNKDVPEEVYELILDDPDNWDRIYDFQKTYDDKEYAILIKIEDILVENNYINNNLFIDN